MSFISFLGSIFGLESPKAFDRLLEADEAINGARFEEARELYTEAFNGFQKAGQLKGMASALIGLGNVHHAFGEYKASIQAHQQALDWLRSETRTEIRQGRALNGLGNAHAALGEYAAAIDCHQRHLAIAEVMDDSVEKSNALGNLTQTYHLMGKFDRAIEMGERTLELDKELENPLGMHHTLTNLGNSHLMGGNVQEAIAYHEQALEIAREINNQRFEALSLANLADSYLIIQQFQRMFELAREALSLFERLKDGHSLGPILTKVGIACFHLQRLDDAEEYLERARHHAEDVGDLRTLSKTLTYLGHVLMVREDLDRAEEIYDQNLKVRERLGNPSDIAVALGSLGMLYRARGHFDKAIKAYRRCLPMTEDEPANRGLMLFNLGQTYSRANRLEEAEPVLWEALEVWEELWEKVGVEDAFRISLFEQQALCYNLLQHVLVENGRPLEALEVAERGRARSLVDLMGRQLAEEHDLSVDGDGLDLGEMRQIARRSGTTLVFMSSIREEVGPLEMRVTWIYLWTISPTGEVNFRRSSTTPLRPFLDRIQQSQPQVRPRLEQVPERVDKNRALPSLEAFGVAEDDVRELGRRPPQDIDEEFLRVLYELCFAPLAADNQLPTEPSEPVALIPDSALLLIPWAAVLDGDEQPLVLKHSLLVSPSIGILELMLERRRLLSSDEGQVLVVGDPTMPWLPQSDGELYQPKQLAGAKDEALDIAELFGVEALIGEAATKSEVMARMPNQRFIHLATHGLFKDDGTTETPGAIVLAGPTPETALLTPVEILGMDLDAELVTLSACNTGQGRFTQEGLIGLFRALLQAGAGNVLVTLWAVNDSSTAFLMTKFYRAVKDGESKPRALQRAILETRERYPHPLHWAPFILIGEPG